MDRDVRRAVSWSRLVSIVPGVAWVVVAVVGWPVVDSAIVAEGAQRPAALALVAAVWVINAIAVSVPSVWSLTVARIVSPIAVLGSAAAWAATGEHGSGAATFIAAAVASVVVLSGEYGRAWVQSSAYGDEERFPLRPPSAFLVAAIVVLALAATAMLVGYAALGRSTVVATIAFVVAGGLFALGLPRWHRLSRRWLVLVPAGIVVHDPLVLSETAMWRRHSVAGAALARSDTAAADLSGPAAGHMIEVTFAESMTVILTDGRRNPRGRAIHLTAGLVAPSRPGAALAAMRRRGITA
jgi:hypothetical protein